VSRLLSLTLAFGEADTRPTLVVAVGAVDAGVGIVENRSLAGRARHPELSLAAVWDEFRRRNQTLTRYLEASPEHERGVVDDFRAALCGREPANRDIPFSTPDVDWWGEALMLALKELDPDGRCQLLLLGDWAAAKALQAAARRALVGVGRGQVLLLAPDPAEQDLSRGAAMPAERLAAVREALDTTLRALRRTPRRAGSDALETAEELAEQIPSRLWDFGLFLRFFDAADSMSDTQPPSYAALAGAAGLERIAPKAGTSLAMSELGRVEAFGLPREVDIRRLLSDGGSIRVLRTVRTGYRRADGTVIRAPRVEVEAQEPESWSLRALQRETALVLGRDAVLFGGVLKSPPGRGFAPAHETMLHKMLDFLSRRGMDQLRQRWEVTLNRPEGLRPVPEDSGRSAAGVTRRPRPAAYRPTRRVGASPDADSSEGTAVLKFLFFAGALVVLLFIGLCARGSIR
jgi:hypothetical protein